MAHKAGRRHVEKTWFNLFHFALMHSQDRSCEHGAGRRHVGKTWFNVSPFASMLSQDHSCKHEARRGRVREAEPALRVIQQLGRAEG